MDDKALLRGAGRDWVLDDIIPEETINSQGVPVKLRPLNLRQLIFVKEYCKTLSAAKAAKEIGISASTANNWLQGKAVRRAVQINLQNRIKTAEIDANWVLDNTREIVDRCMSEQNFQPGYALKALEMVGKHFGMFVDRQVIDVNQKTVIRIESNIDVPKMIDVTP